MSQIPMITEAQPKIDVLHVYKLSEDEQEIWKRWHEGKNCSQDDIFKLLMRIEELRSKYGQ